MFQAVSRQSVSDVVFDQLRGRIVSQQLRAGEDLPSERILCELLQVSRNAVREAIKRLQQAGLVEVRHGGATTVLDFRNAAGPELLPSLLMDEQGRLQLEVARSIVRMRQVLSPEIAADAAQNRDEQTANALDEVIAAMQQQEDPAARQMQALRFWEMLVDASGNIAYRLAFNSLRKTYEPIWGLLTGMLQREFQDLDSFCALAAAVRAQDRQAAFDTAKDYIDRSSQAIYQFLAAYARSVQAGAESEQE